MFFFMYRLSDINTSLRAKLTQNIATCTYFVPKEVNWNGQRWGLVMNTPVQILSSSTTKSVCHCKAISWITYIRLYNSSHFWKKGKKGILHIKKIKSSLILILLLFEEKNIWSYLFTGGPEIHVLWHSKWYLSKMERKISLEWKRYRKTEKLFVWAQQLHFSLLGAVIA